MAAAAVLGFVKSDHGLCGSNKLLYKRCALSMGEAKFRPPQLPHFHPILLKLKTKKHIRDKNRRAKFGKDRFTRGVWATTLILAVHSGLPFLQGVSGSCKPCTSYDRDVCPSVSVRPSVRPSHADIV